MLGHTVKGNFVVNNGEHTYDIPDESAMLAFGEQLAGTSLPGSVIFLRGQLGVGKTTLTRGFLRAFGYLGAVKSPTYTLVEPYEFNGQHIFHFDLYRLQEPQELEHLGIHEYFDGRSICLIEWPEQGFGLLPPPTIECKITVAGAGRQITVQR